jgi:hypothetical protein
MSMSFSEEAIAHSSSGYIFCTRIWCTSRFLKEKSAPEAIQRLDTEK